MALSLSWLPAHPLGQGAEEALAERPELGVTGLVDEQRIQVPKVSRQVAPHAGVSLVAIRVCHCQELADWEIPRARQRISVALEAKPVGVRQRARRDGRNKGGPILCAQVYPVEPGLLRVHFEPRLLRVGRRRLKRYAVLRCFHERRRRTRAPGRCDAERHLPRCPGEGHITR